MSETPPAKKIEITSPEGSSGPIDVAGLLRHINGDDSSKLQPEDNPDKVNDLNNQIGNTPSPATEDTVAEQIDEAWNQHGSPKPEETDAIDRAEQPTLAQLEARWMDLVRRYVESNGDANIRNQVILAHDAWLTERGSAGTLVQLTDELKYIREQYGKQWDKNSPEARMLVGAAAAKQQEIIDRERYIQTMDVQLGGAPAESVPAPTPAPAPIQAPKLEPVPLPGNPVEPGVLKPLNLSEPLLRAVQEEMKKELKAIVDKDSPEAKALSDQLAIIDGQLQGAGGQNPAPGYNGALLIDTEKMKAEMLRERASTVIRSEVYDSVYEGQDGTSITHGERLKSAMSRYAELKATSETRGNVQLGKVILWNGRARREKKLREVEAELTEATHAFEMQVIRKKREANLYDGTEEQQHAQCSNDLLTGMRSLDTQTRQATNDVLDSREKKGGLFRTAAIKLGNWLRTGSKIGKWAKAGGTGAGVGTGVALLATVGGVGWPISSALAGGASLAVRTSVKTASLDAMRKAENHEGVMTDAVYNELSAQPGSTAESYKATAQTIAQRIFDASREKGYSQVDRANKEVAGVMGKYGIAMLAGASVTAGIHHLMQNDVPVKGIGKDPIPKDPKPGGTIHGLKDRLFDVQSGSGYVRELREFVGANGQHLTASQSDSLHHALMDKFGKDYIDIRGVGKDIYTQAGDVRLSAPGKATWQKGVAEFTQQWMQNKGIWK